MSQEYYSYSDDYFNYLPFTAEVIGGEWLPKAASDREALIGRSDKAFTDKGVEAAVRRFKNELTAEDIPEGTQYVDVPFVYYKGYAAVDPETNSALALSGEGENGTVRIHTDGSRAVRVYYKGTALQHIGSALSLGTLIGILIYLLIKKKRKSIEKPSGEGGAA